MLILRVQKRFSINSNHASAKLYTIYSKNRNVEIFAINRGCLKGMETIL